MSMLSSPGYSRAFAITPHDTNPLTKECRAIYVGGAGNLTVRLVNDAGNVTFTAVPVGTVLEVSPKLVLATLTTATLLIGLA